MTAVLGACAGSTSTAHAAIDPRIAHACGVTMDLGAGTQDYSDCVSGIRSALAEVRQTATLQREWAACSAKGLIENTPAYATCVLNQDETTVSRESGDGQ